MDNIALHEKPAMSGFVFFDKDPWFDVHMSSDKISTPEYLIDL